MRVRHRTQNKLRHRIPPCSAGGGGRSKKTKEKKKTKSKKSRRREEKREKEKKVLYAALEGNDDMAKEKEEPIRIELVDATLVLDDDIIDNCQGTGLVGDSVVCREFLRSLARRVEH